MSDGRFIGIDVGGTKVATAVLTGGKFENFDPVPTATGSSDELVGQLLQQIDAHRGPDALSVAIGLPSIIDRASGRVRHTVNLPLSDLPLRSLIAERCGLPVYVENDASCAALAEASHAGQIICENLIMFTIGTGVGGGTVLGGTVYRGATGAAPEIGHQIIGLDLSDGDESPDSDFPQPGSLEALASGRALDRLALDAARRDPSSFLGRRLAADGEVTGHDAVDGAKEGDEASRRCLRVLGERLGIGIANAINLYDPLEVVIGGGVSTAGDLLLEPAERVAFRHVLPGVGSKTKIRLARHGPRAGVLGAALMAAQEYLSKEGGS